MGVLTDLGWLMVLRAGVRVVGESELRALGGCLGAKRR